MTNKRHEELEAIFANPAPREGLISLATRCRDAGMSQADLYQLFAAYTDKVDANTTAYDALLDVLDLIWGGPHAKGWALYPEELSDERTRGRSQHHRPRR